MATIRILKKAPIKEALVDIRVSLPNSASLSQLDAMHEMIVSDYPKKEERKKIEARINIKTGDVTKEISTDGYFFKSADGINVVQFRLDGFTFSRLKPYQDWERLQLEAKRLWEIYLKHARPMKITRIALRYINHIKLPIPAGDLDDYFVASPIIPETLPQVLSGFLTRVSFTDPATEATAIVTQTYESIGEVDSATVIFDIDVFKGGIFKEEEIWDVILGLRGFKNKIFFESLTERLLETYA